MGRDEVRPRPSSARRSRLVSLHIFLASCSMDRIRLREVGADLGSAALPPGADGTVASLPVLRDAKLSVTELPGRLSVKKSLHPVEEIQSSVWHPTLVSLHAYVFMRPPGQCEAGEQGCRPEQSLRNPHVAASAHGTVLSVPASAVGVVESSSSSANPPCVQLAWSALGVFRTANPPR
jgi:hypothetical protein